LIAAKIAHYTIDVGLHYFPSLSVVIYDHDNGVMTLVRKDGEWYRKPHHNGALQGYPYLHAEIERCYQQWLVSQVILGDRE
jgi:hypothetical protein